MFYNALQYLPFRSSYAETHYKFKLPWSPLCNPWPEIFFDGPHFSIPGVEPTFYLGIKDADYFPVKVNEIRINVQHNANNELLTFPIHRDFSQQIEFVPFPLPQLKEPGDYVLNVRIDVEGKNGKRRSLLNHNFSGVEMAPLLFKRLSEPLPYPPHWHAGEMHCHSNFSSDPVEFGAPLSVLREAGKSLGLNFVMCTDHSYDFYYEMDRYMNPQSPEVKWNAYSNQAAKLNEANDGSFPLMIPGEEVSCGNAKGENVHLLVMGHPEFLDGHGDGGRRWFNNRPDYTVAQILEQLGGTPCFAAHPKANIGVIEKALFRRGAWSAEDVLPKGKESHSTEASRGINGLQFWNGNRGLDFSRGRAFWVQQLLAGKKVLPIGANDAHGDLNYNIGVKIPLFSLYRNRNHLFGNVRTLIQADSPTLAELQKGIRMGKICATDGPFLNLVKTGGNFTLSANSNSDFGMLEKIILFSGCTGDSKETVEKVWENLDAQTFQETYTAKGNPFYLRAEAWTKDKKLAISAPVYPGT